MGADRFVQGDVLTLDWTSRFSGIISNPPYERTIDIGPARRDELRERFYSARGQFDLWFTFVERALQLLEPRGRGVFLIPGGLETRPAAARLRDVLNAYSAWRVDRDVGAAFADSVGVCPELLIFDRNDETWGQAHQRWSHLFDVDERVSVGAATGSDSVFLLAEGDPWLAVLPASYVRSVVRGRDIRRGFAVPNSQSVVFPYLVSGSRISPARVEMVSGLADFVAAHEGKFGSRPARSGLFIQCPLRAVLGERLVVPEIFREPRAALVESGVVVLNSAFVLEVGERTRRDTMLDWLLGKEGTESLTTHSRLLSGNYRRVTASGLSRVLSDFECSQSEPSPGALEAGHDNPQSAPQCVSPAAESVSELRGPQITPHPALQT